MVIKFIIIDKIHLVIRLNPQNSRCGLSHFIKNTIFFQPICNYKICQNANEAKNMAAFISFYLNVIENAQN